MNKVKSSISINVLAAFGWGNLFVQTICLYTLIKSYPVEGSVVDSISLMYMFGVAIDLIFMGIAGMLFLIEYLSESSTSKVAFKFPHNKINQDLYNIFFYIGLFGIVLPIVIPFFAMKNHCLKRHNYPINKLAKASCSLALNGSSRQGSSP